jgi:cytoskeletal protein CcmA (bactofilin family)
MFASKKKTTEQSYFAAGVTMKGRLCFEGVIRLDGRVHGEIISSGTLVVEETAIIIGDILVESIVLSGTVYGNIRAAEHVQLNATAKVFGHIEYGDLSIEGAVHEGSSHKLNSDEVAEVKRECQDMLEQAAGESDRYRDECCSQFQPIGRASRVVPKISPAPPADSGAEALGLPSPRLQKEA